MDVDMGLVEDEEAREVGVVGEKVNECAVDG